MNKLIALAKKFALAVKHYALIAWKRFLALPRWGQAVVIAGILALVWGIGSLLGGAASTSDANTARSVTLQSVAEMSGNASGESVVGSVRARSEAEMRAEAAGTVKRVNTVIGASVPAGFVIAELENASESAQVTQAEGAYDAAVAARNAVSPVNVDTTGRNAYRTAFDTLDTALETQVDQLFGGPTPYGPDLLINPIGSDPTPLSRERKRIDDLVDTERGTLASVNSRNPESLLASMETLARTVATFVDKLAETANATNSNATPEQVAAVVSARTSVNGVLSSITAARASLQSGSTNSTASVDAGVKSALGTLRLAQASLEKTRVRAPIAGTVNFLPIRVGDYVGNLDHVATVAQNGALEIVSYVSEEAAANLVAGGKVTVEGTYEGIITTVSPALDPVNKQIEVHVSVMADSGLVNGQSVRLTLPGGVPSATAATGPILLPLSAVKLSAGARVVFTVTEEGRLSAIPVEIAEVRGDRIEIVSGLPLETRIVLDARGLADGQQVNIAEAK